MTIPIKTSMASMWPLTRPRVAMALALATVCAASVASLEHPRNVPFAFAFIPLTTSVIMWLRAAEGPLKTTARLVTLYLLFLPINEAMSVHVSLCAGGSQIHLAFGVIVLLGLVLARLFDTDNAGTTDDDEVSSGVMRAWLVAVAIIAAHVVLLRGLLDAWYGYGFERDVPVLGALCAYYLIFRLLWQRSGNEIWRRLACVLSSLYYLALVLH